MVEGYKRERDAALAEIESLKRICDEYQRDGTYKEGLIARQDLEIAALTERYVPLVEENERLTREVEESSIARTIHFGEAERLRERVAALTADVCPRCGTTLRDPVGGGKP